MIRGLIRTLIRHYLLKNGSDKEMKLTGVSRTVDLIDNVLNPGFWASETRDSLFFKDSESLPYHWLPAIIWNYLITKQIENRYASTDSTGPQYHLQTEWSLDDEFETGTESRCYM